MFDFPRQIWKKEEREGGVIGGEGRWGDGGGGGGDVRRGGRCRREGKMGS